MGEQAAPRARCVLAVVLAAIFAVILVASTTAVSSAASSHRKARHGSCTPQRHIKLASRRVRSRRAKRVCLPKGNRPTHSRAPQLGGGYPNARIAEIALGRLGQYGGECKEAVNVWVGIASGGSERLGGDYLANYRAEGGQEVSRDQSVEGDIIQLNGPNGRYYYEGMHTAVVVSHSQGSNNFVVVDSNWNWQKKVTKHEWNPYITAAAHGLSVHIWRMGSAGSPPAPTSGPPPTVAFVSPGDGQVVSGVTTLAATTTNATGVEFDAYYATDPRNVATVGWHKLGDATHGSGGSWTFAFDTRAIPDQGNVGWGTVNIAASPLDSSGNQTPARDYRRVTIANGNSSAAIALQNPSFEANVGCAVAPSGWFFSRNGEGYGDCIYADPSNSYDGSNFLDVVSGSPPVSLAQDVPVIPGPGETYVLTAYVKSPPGEPPGAQGRLALWALSGNEEHSATPFTTTGSWQQISVTLTPTAASHSALRAEIYYDSPGQRILLDDVALQRTG